MSNVDNNPPTTSTAPIVSPSATESADARTLNQKQSFIRHTPSAYNTFAYQPNVGKNLASLLVDESGMAPRFHLLGANIFLASIDGAAPTEDDYEKFKEPDLASKKKEHELYPELVSGFRCGQSSSRCLIQPMIIVRSCSVGPRCRRVRRSSLPRHCKPQGQGRPLWQEGHLQRWRHLRQFPPRPRSDRVHG